MFEYVEYNHQMSNVLLVIEKLGELKKKQTLSYNKIPDKFGV